MNTRPKSASAARAVARSKSARPEIVDLSKMPASSIRLDCRGANYFAGHPRHSAMPRPMIHSRSPRDRNFISSVNSITACG